MTDDARTRRLRELLAEWQQDVDTLNKSARAKNRAFAHALQRAINAVETVLVETAVLDTEGDRPMTNEFREAVKALHDYGGVFSRSYTSKFCGADEVITSRKLVDLVARVMSLSGKWLQADTEGDRQDEVLAISEAELYKLAARVVHQKDTCRQMPEAGPCEFCVNRVDFARLCILKLRLWADTEGDRLQDEKALSRVDQSPHVPSTGSTAQSTTGCAPTLNYAVEERIYAALELGGQHLDTIIRERDARGGYIVPYHPSWCVCDTCKMKPLGGTT